MKSEALKNYASLIIFSGNSSIVAQLSYSVAEHTYIATLPASGTFASVKDEHFKLTAAMVGRIVCQPDGTISLSL